MSLASPIRWAGSKRKLLPVLKEFWRPTDRKYIEAFSGSACLFFHLRPQTAVLNDANVELISAFKILAKQPNLLHDAVQAMPSDRESYYRVRSQTHHLDEFVAATRFFFLNRHCFNGIYRTNRLGVFNVPYASYKTGKIPSLDKWIEAGRCLKSAQLFSTDFEEAVVTHVSSGDFVYLDPPYAVSNRRIFSQYSANEFGADDLRRLRSVMRHIDSVGATFVVSYALSKETSELSRGWFVTRRLAQRNVAGFSRHRRKAVEILITNDPERIPTGRQ